MNERGQVGVVGLGLMGRAFAQRLLGAGHAVAGHDVRPVDIPGVQLHSTVTGLAAGSQAVLLAVFDTPQVEQVLFDEGGLADSLAPGTPVICTSTCDPEAIERLGHRCAARAIRFLELPFSGTSQQVARGDGVGLAGGDPALVDELAPLLDVICPRRHHVGTWGDGSRAKLAVNLVLGLHRAALAEGLNFGRRIGLEPGRLLDILQASAASSSVMPVKGPMMVQRRYEPPQSRVDQSLKDFALIRGLGRKAGQPLPLAELYVELLEACVARGEAHLDNAIIHEALARRAADGQELRA